jgi:hypothetical protein
LGRRPSRSPLRALFGLVALVALLAAPASGEVVQKGNLIVSFGGSIAPPSLPRDSRAPIEVRVDGRVNTADGRLPPSLRRISLEINRNGVLYDRGLPSCRIERIRPASTGDAIAECGAAEVGGGRASGQILLPGQPPFPFSSRVVAFKGTTASGGPAILAHVYTGVPIPLTFVLRLSIQHTPGTFGTRLLAVVPEQVRRVTRITRFSLHLGRLYSFAGKRRSYLSAGCPAPEGFPGATFPLARMSFRFDQGLTLSSVLIRTCHAR